jgi:tetratricopeptide (TPR) repeat protein
LRWRYRVHETVLSEELPPNVELQYTDLVIQHSGYQDAAVRRRKLTRDLQLLQRDFTLNPDDPRTLFYLGWSYLELGQTANALRYLRRLAQRQPNNRKLYTLLALCHSQQQQREEALEACRRGLARFPSDVELLYHQGRLLGELGDLEGAESSLLALLTGPAEQYIEFGVTAGLRGPVTRYLLGLLYHQEGRYAECELQLRRALVERPDYIPAWVILGQLYLTLGRTLELDEVVRRLSGCPGGEPYAWVLQARQYLILGALDVARPLLDQALAAAPTLLWARLVLSDLLFQEGRDWEACVQMHQEILAAAPEMDQIRRRLEALLRLSRQPGEPSASSPAEPMGSSEPDLVTVLPQRE